MSTHSWESAGPLLSEWQSSASKSQRAHFYAEGYFASHKLWLGVPVIILTTIVGTTVFATLQREVEVWIRILLGGVSVLAAVLAALQTFLGYPERAESHRVAGAQYGALRRSIEVKNALPVEDRGEAKEFVEKLQQEFDRLAKESPPLPSWALQKAQAPTTGGPSK